MTRCAIGFDFMHDVFLQLIFYRKKSLFSIKVNYYNEVTVVELKFDENNVWKFKLT